MVNSTMMKGVRQKRIHCLYDWRKHGTVNQKVIILLTLKVQKKHSIYSTTYEY